MDEFESLSHSWWECKYHVQGNRMNGYQLKSAEQLMTIFMK
ncbi:hypothetical protein DFR34_1153 [Rivihabitans pingtungensis]|uniref:Uncharacterized protein n=1 Tax=Rivihabitans pingtungensis TaxID=1054498 RepID=A0A318KIL9_9NEIS|nr:hypothetical protein DFR34_1153 [Rivihabitans pingtungensis]